MKQEIEAVFARELQKLSNEIAGYADERLIWRTVDGISNSAGNLCLHLCGNLRHFIGAVLGGTGYIRDRDAEFALKDVPKEKLLAEIETAAKEVHETLSRLEENSLDEIYPINVLGEEHKTSFFLLHLIAHFGYHLGQINYHRRLIK